MDPNITKYIGSGIVFPIILDDLGKPGIHTGFELIEASLKIILSWPKGTRFFLGEFGGDIERVIDEPNDEIAFALVKEYVIQAISLWEKRIKFLDLVILEQTEGVIRLQLTYKIKNSDLEHTFIFPYYSALIY